MLFSDFQQLVPPKGYALFTSLDKLKKLEEISSRNTQYVFDRTIELTTIKRQEGIDPTFLEALAALRKGTNYI